MPVFLVKHPNRKCKQQQQDKIMDKPIMQPELTKTTDKSIYCLASSATASTATITERENPTSKATSESNNQTCTNSSGTKELKNPLKVVDFVEACQEEEEENEANEEEDEFELTEETLVTNNKDNDLVMVSTTLATAGAINKMSPVGDNKVELIFYL